MKISGRYQVNKYLFVYLTSRRGNSPYLYYGFVAKATEDRYIDMGTHQIEFAAQANSIRHLKEVINRHSYEIENRYKNNVFGQYGYYV